MTLISPLCITTGRFFCTLSRGCTASHSADEERWRQQKGAATPALYAVDAVGGTVNHIVFSIVFIAFWKSPSIDYPSPLCYNYLS